MFELPGAHPRYGIEFDWLAVDVDDRVALFSTAGYGPVPGNLLALVDEMDDALDELPQLPILGGPQDPAGGEDGDRSEFLALSRRGLYVYDWHIHHGPYELLATPSEPLGRMHLPQPLRNLAGLVVFPFPFAARDRLELPYQQPPGVPDQAWDTVARQPGQ